MQLVNDVFGCPEFTDPTPDTVHTSSVRGRFVLRINRDFLEALLGVCTGARLVAEKAESFDKCCDSFVSRRLRRPVRNLQRVGPPPPFFVTCRERDTVVGVRRRAGDLVFTRDQVGKRSFDLVAGHVTTPFSRPHASHAPAILSNRPRSSGETGSAPVIAFSAQNRSHGPRFSSSSTRGITRGPSPMIP